MRGKKCSLWFLLPLNVLLLIIRMGDEISARQARYIIIQDKKRRIVQIASARWNKRQMALALSYVRPCGVFAIVLRQVYIFEMLWSVFNDAANLYAHKHSPSRIREKGMELGSMWWRENFVIRAQKCNPLSRYDHTWWNSTSLDAWRTKGFCAPLWVNRFPDWFRDESPHSRDRPQQSRIPFPSDSA